MNDLKRGNYRRLETRRRRYAGVALRTTIVDRAPVTATILAADGRNWCRQRPTSNALSCRGCDFYQQVLVLIYRSWKIITIIIIIMSNKNNIDIYLVISIFNEFHWFFNFFFHISNWFHWFLNKFIDFIDFFFKFQTDFIDF